jgi:hypothetical protein
MAEPAPEDVDAVLFLVGDAGMAEEGRTPTIRRLAQDVEAWAGALPDSAVMAVFLGDNVYEVGIRDPQDPGYAQDTLRLNTQVRAVAGPMARERHVRGVFLPGNHDWGNLKGEAGLARAGNMAEHLAGWKTSGAADVAFLPQGGDPGPASLDLGDHARLLALDGHWWLQGEDSVAKAAVMRRIADAMAGAGARHVVIASHLPLLTGGPHGGTIQFFPTFGLRFLAHKSGMLIQDVTAKPYQELIAAFREVFDRVGPPLAMAGGHDHSLQVLEDTLPGGRTWTQLLSGAGSKLTDLRPVPGMKWGRRAPGYMHITFIKDGTALLHVTAGAAAYKSCDGDGDLRLQCMAEGADSMHVAYTTRLR